MKLKAKRGNKGFTLIELLVVVLIIGILASIAVPQYFRIVEKGRAAEAINMISAIRGAQERYYMKAQAYAGQFNYLDIGGNNAFQSNKYNNSIGMSGSATGFSATLTRTGGPAPYNNYTVVYSYNQTTGNGTWNSSSNQAKTDLLP